MRKLAIALVAVLALPALCAPAMARIWFEWEPMIWKAVRVAPGEGPWQACSRNYRNDVLQASWGPPGIAYCYVPYYYLYGPGQSRQNFNR